MKRPKHKQYDVELKCPVRTLTQATRQLNQYFILKAIQVERATFKYQRQRAEKSCMHINNKIASYKAITQGQSALMPSEKHFLESFLPQTVGGETVGSGVRGTWRHTLDSFEKLNLQLRNLKAVICVYVRVGVHARVRHID